MPHTQFTLFADMLSLLKELEWEHSTDDRWPGDFCPICYGEESIGHGPDCHLQSTIALAEEQVRKIGQESTPA